MRPCPSFFLPKGAINKRKLYLGPLSPGVRVRKPRTENCKQRHYDTRFAARQFVSGDVGPLVPVFAACGRVLDLFDIDTDAVRRWKGLSPANVKDLP